MTVSICNPEELIERECADPAMKQLDVAKSYGLAILGMNNGEAYNWARMNRAIETRWPKGLMRVKKLAWEFVEGKHRV